jgi:8-oxo-dGTP pyrophosphatase MutT (NUDIX family)
MNTRANQVAALPWRRSPAGIQILLVTTRTTRRWVIPKGWPMAGKTDHEAAATEAYEESGARGTISSKASATYDYFKLSPKGKARLIKVTVYPLEVKHELSDWPERHERERRWMSCEEAAALTGEPELVPILRDFVAPPEKMDPWSWLLNWFRS